MEVDILFGHQDDPYDWITQQWLVTTRLNIRQDGQPERILEHHHPHRWYLAQELRALIDLSGAFSQTWFYGDMMTPPPAIASEAERMKATPRSKTVARIRSISASVARFRSTP